MKSEKLKDIIETGDIRIDKIMPELFSNWIQLPFEDCLDKTGEYVKLKQKDTKANGKYPVVDQGVELINGYVDDENLLYKGELPVIIFGDHTRRIKFIDFPFAVGADGTKIFKPKKFINERFFNYYLNSLTIASEGYSRHYKFLKAVNVPLPPLPEQQRIVEKLDALVDRISNSKTRLEKIPALLKNFRQSAPLAFISGTLKEIELSEVCDLDVGYAFKSSEFETKGIRLLRGENMEPGKLRWLDTRYFPKNKLKEFSHLFLNEGDVVLAMDRPIISTGLKIARVKDEDLPCVLVQRVCRFTPKKKLISDFLYLQLNSMKFIEHLTANQTGTQIPHISGKQIMSFKISIPSLEDQKVIVRKVEELFHFADSIEAHYLKAKAWFDKIPQAILAKTFRGELVPQNENDEPASVLLERIQLEKNVPKKKKPKRKKAGIVSKLKVYSDILSYLNEVKEPVTQFEILQHVKTEPGKFLIELNDLISKEIILKKETKSITIYQINHENR